MTNMIICFVVRNFTNLEQDVNISQRKICIVSNNTIACPLGPLFVFNEHDGIVRFKIKCSFVETCGMIKLIIVIKPIKMRLKFE